MTDTVDPLKRVCTFISATLAASLAIERWHQVVIFLDAKHSDLFETGSEPIEGVSEVLRDDDTLDRVDVVDGEIDGTLFVFESLVFEKLTDVSVGVSPRTPRIQLSSVSVSVDRYGIYGCSPPDAVVTDASKARVTPLSAG